MSDINRDDDQPDSNPSMNVDQSTVDNEDKKEPRKGFISWIINHFRPGVDIDNPKPGSDSPDKKNVTFWIRFAFRF